MNFIKIQPTLNPAFWTPDGKLDEKIRERLIQIAQDFYKETELPAPIKDIWFLGSNANFNWTNQSDVDVHVMIDFKSLNGNLDIDVILTNALKQMWNKQHDIKIKGYKVELYIQDISTTKPKVGTYSLLNNHWLTPPEKENVQLDTSLILQKYNLIVHKIKTAVNKNDVLLLKNVLESVYNMRQAGLTKQGEYSIENILFKTLRNKGWLDYLKQIIICLYDKKMSIKEDF